MRAYLITVRVKLRSEAYLITVRVKLRREGKSDNKIKLRSEGISGINEIKTTEYGNI